MGSVLNNLEPREVFHFFEEISKIPRCSGNEKQIRSYLVKFAIDHNLEHIEDKKGNVIIRKPATCDHESSPGVILQCHMDMVCEKNKDTHHNFDSDPIQLRVVGDMVYATQTTLGADNGIALAYCLALLASTDIPHPPLEMLATVEEETGMGGAAALDPQLLKGRYLINIDSEEEGKLLVSCAGGARIIHSLPIEREPSKDEYLACLISICGLKGGHSGMEIHKGRGNANKLMGRILNDMADKLNFSIAEINGGAKMNAIPRESDAIIVLDPKDFPLLRDTISEWDSILKNEYCVSDPGISIHLKQLKETIAHVFSKKTGEAVISTLMLTPDGVQTMSMEIEGLVESSTNLGVVTMMKNRLLFESAVRSSVRSRKYSIIAQLKQIAQVLGLQFTIDSDYPEWEYNPHSTLLKIFKEVHHNQYGKDPEITAIHAGLECGLLKEKKPELDMISFGPNIYDVHTPDEHFSISSVKRTWEYLLAVLQEIR